MMQHHVPLRRIPWAIVVASTALVFLLVLSPPFVDARAGALVQYVFSAFCHQLPERSMHVHGISLAVCSRCIGIYGGLMLSVMLFPIAARLDARIWPGAGLWLLVGVGVPGLDWLAGLTGMWNSGHVLRLATGAVFGLITGYLLARAASFPAREARAETAGFAQK